VDVSWSDFNGSAGERDMVLHLDATQRRGSTPEIGSRFAGGYLARIIEIRRASRMATAAGGIP
jgi:hypothetical protein